MENKDEKPKGMGMVFALYILTILQKGQAYGNNIASEIERRTHQLIICNPNTLYPLLRSLEQKGYIIGAWDNPDTRGKRIYSLTKSGAEMIPVVQEKALQHLDEWQQKITVLHKDLCNQ